MSITISATHLELTPAIKDYIEKRLSGLQKFTAGEPTILVEVSQTTHHHRQGSIFSAKVQVTTPLGKQYVAESEKPDLYEAVDDVRNEVARELASAKDKRDSLVRRGARRIKSILKGFR